MAEQKLASKREVIVLAAGLIVGFVAGFALANGVNRGEHDRLRAELTRLRSGGAGSGTEPGRPAAAADSGDATVIPDLTQEQLRKAVADADARPGDLELQRTAGQGLYLYAMQKGDASILPDAARILRRAHDADPKDYQLAVIAANAHFVVARSGGDSAALKSARELYEAALAEKPDDVIARTSLGLTYFYDRPPDVRRAVREYRRALEVNPRHEMTLQSLAAALVEAGELEEAARRLSELESVNAENSELANLRAQLEQKRNAAREKP
ncbi:MAG TPA: tetratricopeptide repeat protein [Pyrinomonadaceae bacterium]|nr:tetratricopeptide repeat protein [Pyrinomonadaceae bacterium]